MSLYSLSSPSSGGAAGDAMVEQLSRLLVQTHASGALSAAHSARHALDLQAVETCELVSNTFGAALQLLLGIVSFSALGWKWAREHPRRPFGIWARDSSKQAVAACVLHIINLMVAHSLGNGHAMQNACVWYFVAFIVDTVLGCLCAWGLLELWNAVAIRLGSALFQSGYYGSPPRNRVWLLQLSQWLLICVVVKFVLLFALMIPAGSELYAASAYLLRPFHSDPKLLLVMVMIVIPLVLNAIVFYIQDTLLMDQSLAVAEARTHICVDPKTEAEYTRTQDALHAEHPMPPMVGFESYFAVPAKPGAGSCPIGNAVSVPGIMDAERNTSAMGGAEGNAAAKRASMPVVFREQVADGDADDDAPCDSTPVQQRTEDLPSFSALKQA